MKSPLYIGMTRIEFQVIHFYQWPNFKKASTHQFNYYFYYTKMTRIEFQVNRLYTFFNSKYENLVSITIIHIDDTD